MKLWIFGLIFISFVFWYLISRVWSTNNNLDITREQDSFVFPTPKITTTDPFATQSSGFDDAN